MRLCRLTVVLFLLINKVYAIEAIDVYGVDDKTAQAILAENSQDIVNYVKKSMTVLRHGLPQNMINLKRMHDAIMHKINHMGHFIFINFSNITYSKGETFVTIDLVTDKERYRMPSSPHRHIKQDMTIKKQVKDLIALWAEYDAFYTEQFMMRTFDSSIRRDCPALHCLYGFDAKDLIKYYQPLHKGAQQYQQALVDIIAHSPDDIMRGHAIFVLANGCDVAFVTALMTQYIDDESSLIRNNAMRVLAYIVANHDSKAIPVKKLIKALNYPDVTDRNKSQAILIHIAHKDPATHAFIMAQGAQTLVKLLKLRQPNNHDAAYEILKTVSHKTYGDRDIKAWQAWANRVQPSS